MMNAIKELDTGLRNKVLGTVLFGYTKNGQTSGSIAGYPKDRLMVICRSDDGVCGGSLAVTAGHFGYLLDGSGTKATNFLAEKINSAKSSKASKDKSGDSSSAPAAPAAPAAGRWGELLGMLGDRFRKATGWSR